MPFFKNIAAFLVVIVLLSGCGYNRVKLEEVPELEYNIDGVYNYVCYKDLLIMDGTVYRMHNGTYQKTDENLSDLLKTEMKLYENYNQYKNRIVFLSDDRKSFQVYDIDTKQKYTYPCREGKKICEYPWYVYEGGIYYLDYQETDMNRRIFDKTIRKIILDTGEEQEIYHNEEQESDFFWFYMRKDGVIFYELIKTGTEDKREFWKLQIKSNKKWEEIKLWENENWKYRECWALNSHGMIVTGQFAGGVQEGSLFETVLIKDSGGIVHLKMEEGSKVFLETGYLVKNKSDTKRDSNEVEYADADRTWGVTYYDYDGNKIKTYRLVDDEYLNAGYRLRKLFYYNGMITALYVQKNTGELHIVQKELDLQ